MANRATVNSLEAIVRARLNLTNMATISSADLKLFIRSSLAAMYELIANRHRDYYVIPFQFSLETDQSGYPLPQDFRSHTELLLTSGSTPNKSYTPLTQAQSPRDFRDVAFSIASPAWPSKYRIVGNQIYFAPVPGQRYVNAIEMWYVPQFAGPVNDDQSIDSQLPNGWERWVEFDTCVQVASRMRLAEYFQMYSALRAEVEKAVISAASIRDEQPQYMTDVFSAVNVYSTPGEG